MRVSLGMVLLALATASCGQPIQPTVVPFADGGCPGKRTSPKQVLVDDPAHLPRPYALMAAGDLTIVSTAVDSQLSTLPKERMHDMDFATQWGAGGYRNATSWAQFQVGGDASFTSIALKTGPLPADSSYDVQVSSDGAVWTNVLENQRNTTWNMETKTFPAPAAGKFLRVFWRNSPTAPLPRFQIYEVAVRGSFTTGGTEPTPAPTAAPSATPTPVASPTPSPVVSATPTPVASATPSSAPTETPPSGSFPQYWPDLHPLPSRSFYVVMNGASRILRFPATLANIGPGHLRVRGAPVSEGFTSAYQEVLNPSMQVVERKYVGQFFWHAEHNHIHLTDVSRYELRSGSPTGPIVRTANKVSFCLEDSFKVVDSTETALHPDCENPVMGITRTFADFYNAGLPGQEFDVAGLPAGYYFVVIRVDPTQTFLQTRYDNDVSWTRIYLNAATGRTYATSYSE